MARAGRQPAIFAVLYGLQEGSIVNTRRGFADAFFFSVQQASLSLARNEVTAEGREMRRLHELRFADILTRGEDGVPTVDYRRFHDTLA